MYYIGYVCNCEVCTLMLYAVKAKCSPSRRRWASHRKRLQITD